MANIGTIIANRYEIVAEIGRGGMSTVYLAIDKNLKKQWAIKEAKKKPGKDSEIFELTPIAEANLLKTLNHENIVRIVDIIEQDGFIYIVEDFVEGKSLAEEVKKGPCTPEEVVHWGSQLCDVFTYIHSKQPAIIYRDMKPANVQLDTERDKVKLLDFGIAKTYKPQNTSDTTNLGTRGYAAPEQFDVSRQSDARTDIYSLGVTLRSLLMGKTPYDAEFYEDIRNMNPAVSDGLVRVITKATEQSAEKRYQTAEEFKNALQNYHKYDAAFIRRKKRDISLVRGLMASAISIFLVGAVLMPSAFAVRSTNYNHYLDQGTQEACLSAIQLNDGKSEAYKKYVSSIQGQIKSKNLMNTDKSDGAIDYRNISNINERKYVALEIALYKEDSDSLRQGGLGSADDSANATAYYKDLARGFDANAEDMDVTKPLSIDGDIYTAIGQIKYYQQLVYAYANDDKNDSIVLSTNNDPKAEAILNNLKVIKEYIDANRAALLSDDLTDLLASTSVISSYGDMYNFLAVSQKNCIEQNKRLLVIEGDQQRISLIDSCINHDASGCAGFDAGALRKNSN